MRYKVKSHINHDGVLYAEGSMIDLGDKAAVELLKVDAIEPAHRPFAMKATRVMDALAAAGAKK